MMQTVLTVRDHSTGKTGDDHTFRLSLPSETITVRELIRERVYQEADDHNRRIEALVEAGNTADPASPVFRGLVTPNQDETALNKGAECFAARRVDWRSQFDAAIDGFLAKRYILLVGEQQATSLEEEITVSAQTEVTFLRLMLLVGG